MTLGGGGVPSLAIRDMAAKVKFSGAPIKVHTIIETSTPTQEMLSYPETRQVVIFEEFSPSISRKKINFPWV